MAGIIKLHQIFLVWPTWFIQLDWIYVIWINLVGWDWSNQLNWNNLVFFRLDFVNLIWSTNHIFNQLSLVTANSQSNSARGWSELGPAQPQPVYHFFCCFFGDSFHNQWYCNLSSLHKFPTGWSWHSILQHAGFILTKLGKYRRGWMVSLEFVKFHKNEKQALVEVLKRPAIDLSLDLLLDMNILGDIKSCQHKNKSID